jgi:hypothetical protein
MRKNGVDTSVRGMVARGRFELGKLEAFSRRRVSSPKRIQSLLVALRQRYAWPLQSAESNSSTGLRRATGPTIQSVILALSLSHKRFLKPAENLPGEKTEMQVAGQGKLERQELMISSDMERYFVGSIVYRAKI